MFQVFLKVEPETQVGPQEAELRDRVEQERKVHMSKYS